jgi:hypothetical protein
MLLLSVPSMLKSNEANVSGIIIIIIRTNGSSNVVAVASASLQEAETFLK